MKFWSKKQKLKSHQWLWNKTTFKTYFDISQVEKARQRLSQGRKAALYTAESSIEKKVGDVIGWREMLGSMGFRFEKAHGGLPDCVFFPGHDSLETLNRCSNTLYAFLGKKQTDNAHSLPYDRLCFLHFCFTKLRTRWTLHWHLTLWIKSKGSYWFHLVYLN